MRIIVAHIVDMLDHYILRHRAIWLCRIAVSLWPEAPCHCRYCRQFQEGIE